MFLNFKEKLLIEKRGFHIKYISNSIHKRVVRFRDKLPSLFFSNQFRKHTHTRVFAYMRMGRRDTWSRFISGVLAKLFLEWRCRALDVRGAPNGLTLTR